MRERERSSRCGLVFLQKEAYVSNRVRAKCIAPLKGIQIPGNFSFVETRIHVIFLCYTTT